MKLLWASLLIASSAWALEYLGQVVYVRPRIWNFGSQVQVEIYNHTQTDIECRGTVYINGERSTQTEFYNEIIYRSMSRTRPYYLLDFNDRVRYTTDFITCYER